MIHQNVLDLAPPLTLLPSLAGAREAVDDVEYRPSRTARALARRLVPDLAHLDSAEVWKLEPYRGSEFESLEVAPRARASRRRILVNDDLPNTLRRELSRHGHEGLSISIGDRFEAYPTAEPRFAITRSILRVLEETGGFEICLTTRSPLVLRDQDLLQRLDVNHTVTVKVPIATLDKRLAAQLEPNAPDPASRLDIVRSLALDGIAVSVSCGPLLPGLNNSTDELDPLFAAVRLAGAIDVVGDARLSNPKYRRRVAAWLEKHVPERAARVLGLLATHRDGDPLGTLERLRLTYGFPILRAGRG